MLFLLEPSPHSRMKERSLKYKPSCTYVGHTLKQSDMTACTLFCLVTSTQQHVLWNEAVLLLNERRWKREWGLTQPDYKFKAGLKDEYDGRK